MNRNALGIIAAILLLLGGVTVVLGPGGGNASGFAGGCIRVGLVLGALWLALPQMLSTAARLPRWAIGWFFKKEIDLATHRRQHRGPSSNSRDPDAEAIPSEQTAPH